MSRSRGHGGCGCSLAIRGLYTAGLTGSWTRSPASAAWSAPSVLTAGICPADARAELLEVGEPLYFQAWVRELGLLGPVHHRSARTKTSAARLLAALQHGSRKHSQRLR